ncbi:HEAT repeat domain-containing protein [Streptomyces sp. NPDC098789]|uniref:HEAT repeat domain-containing protein n=1 Tax=Streptomyces sp. NPDC098789 TaxID=3366098 RepID=UPI0038133117
MKWLDEAVSAGHATTAAHPSRITVIDALRADRTGPVPLRLLQLSYSDNAFVRREALELLSWAGTGSPWPEAVAASLARLTDPDEEVRRRAAHLVVRAGGRDVGLRALGKLTDPVVRTVLADRLQGSLAHLRDDPLPSVRFLVRLEALRVAPARQRPPLDRALLADAREAAIHLDRVGRRWGRVLCGLGRERHVHALVARLLGDPTTRDIGAGVAREACHHWRAAPIALLPLLVRHCGPEVSPAMAKALTTASVSRAAMRAHGALFATVAVTPYPRPRHLFGSSSPTRSQAQRPTYDSATAGAVLRAKPVDTGRLHRAPELFGALLDAGPLTFREAAQLYNLTFKRPGRMQGVCAPLWLRHAGPTAGPRVLALMTPHLGTYGIGEYYAEGLARMGRHARPALPSLTALIDRRTRIPVNDSTRDGEMMLDEGLLAAALAARHAILADTAPSTPATPDRA